MKLKIKKIYTTITKKFFDMKIIKIDGCIKCPFKVWAGAKRPKQETI